MKASGYGRDLGPEPLKKYRSAKQITEYTSKQKWDWYHTHNKPVAKL